MMWQWYEVSVLRQPANYHHKAIETRRFRNPLNETHWYVLSSLSPIGRGASKPGYFTLSGLACWQTTQIPTVLFMSFMRGQENNRFIWWYDTAKPQWIPIVMECKSANIFALITKLAWSHIGPLNLIRSMLWLPNGLYWWEVGFYPHIMPCVPLDRPSRHVPGLHKEPATDQTNCPQWLPPDSQKGRRSTTRCRGVRVVQTRSSRWRWAEPTKVGCKYLKT